MRGPAVTISLPVSVTMRLFLTAGTDGSGLPRLEVGRRLVVRPEFDDDVRRACEDQLARCLHRLALDVAEHVVAAGDLEHVVQKAVSSAGVDVPQRIRVPGRTRSLFSVVTVPATRVRMSASVSSICLTTRVACSVSPVRAASARIVVKMSASPP